MKCKEDILNRAIVLLAFSDRCALEKKTINGVRRTLNEREAQRRSILDWLLRTGYYNCASEKEKQILNTAVTDKTSETILSMQSHYECLEPLLWSLGLVSELSGYEEFVMQDFHPVLGFGKNHSFEVLLNSCSMVSASEINNRREIAMLWYWRFLEHRSGSSEQEDIKAAIYNIFGEKHIQLLHTYEQFDCEKKDFIIKGRTIPKLKAEEVLRLSVISERRFYAFEWLSSDDEWDNVDLVC